MSSGAQLSVTDKRRAMRHPVEHKVIAEHRQLGDVHVEIVNVSAQGCMALIQEDLGRGERLAMRLPVIGRIEAHVIWKRDERTGLQFERIIRLDEFSKLVDTIQPNPKLRPRR